MATIERQTLNRASVFPKCDSKTNTRDLAILSKLASRFEHIFICENTLTSNISVYIIRLTQNTHKRNHINYTTSVGNPIMRWVTVEAWITPLLNGHTRGTYVRMLIWSMFLQIVSANI